MLYCSICVPYINYCSEIWGNTYATNVECIMVLQKRVCFESVDGEVFLDLEKAYDKMPREEVLYCMRESGLAEKYVSIVQDILGMYDDSSTAVRCAVGVT